MHAELVERRRWISERRFLHALNYCMVLPGPEAQQLATYIGWLMHRTWGGIVAGALFVLPSLFILVGLSWIYIAYGNTTAGRRVCSTGIKPAVTAIVLQAAHGVSAHAPSRAPWPWGIAAARLCRPFLRLQVPFPGHCGGSGHHRRDSTARIWHRRHYAVGGGGHGAAEPGNLLVQRIIDDATPTPPHARSLGGTRTWRSVHAGGSAAMGAFPWQP